MKIIFGIAEFAKPNIIKLMHYYYHTVNNVKNKLYVTQIDGIKIMSLSRRKNPPPYSYVININREK